MSDVNPPLALERGMERLTGFRVFNKELYFFLSCSYRAGLFARSFLQVEARSG